MKQNMDQPCSKWNLLRLFVLICTTTISTLLFGQAGNAPMQSLPNFTGPFAIDGFLQRQGVNGDWLAGPGGATNIVFTDAGVALVPLAYRLTDLYDDLINDDIFDGGNKLFQNPNVWGWRSQKPPGKDDINNSMVFLALNPANNHIWLAISGDRKEINGTSYLDFEFYQNTITKTDGETPPGPPVLGSTGGFVSTGPHNGRTIGDISITLEFTNGGSFASVFYLQWQPGSEAGTYDYFPLTPAPGTAFAASNGGAAPINVPYGAFGGTTYSTQQFAEGAIDLTALIGGTGLPGQCGSLPFKTLFIKTKSSAERTADLKDFILPFQLNVCFDNTPPVISCPNTINLGCNPTIPGPSGATASDNCNGAITPVAADGPVTSNGCSRSMTRTWRATDACGNTATCGQLINWTQDNTPPVFTGSYADVNLGCNPANPGGSLGSASASDACGAVTITQTDGSITSDVCSRSQTRTFTARDACNNTSSTSRTVRWIADPTPPVFTGSYADVNLGCNPANPDGSLGSASATDGCGAVTITSSDGAVQSNGCDRSRTRTFTARDGCNNTATTSRTVRWIADLTPPAFTGSYADVNLGCNPGNPDGSLGSASATDACGAVTITSSDGGVLSDGCNRSRTRTFTAVDGCGNTSSTSRTVRWIADLTPPAFTGSYADVNLGCNPANPDGSLGSASATDACGAVTISSSDGSVVSDGCNRSRTRTFTARDGCSNTSTTSRTVRWIADATPPAFIGGYGDVGLGCNPANPDGSLGSAAATDACGAVTITQSDGPVVTDGCNLSKTRTFTARDGCNNTATISRTVRWTSQASPPTFTGSYADVDLGCNPANPDGSLGSATATAACGLPSITPSDGPVVTNGCARSRTRTFTASDGCGNTATVSRTVRWISDLTPPVYTGSYADVNLGCNPANPDGSLGSASATDGCGAVTITFADGAVISDGCNRLRTRTFTARDGCDNRAITTRTVRWIADLTPPAFTGSYADVNLGCNPANPDGSLGSASATDACGAVTISQSDGSVASDGCNRSRTRTFTARDGCGNTATVSRTVRWIADLTPPAFTGSYADVNLGCNPANPDGSLGSASATDACGAVTISQSDGSVASDGCNRSRTRTFTAIDGCGNTSTTSRTVRWIADLTPPAFTGSYADVNLGCNPANPDGSLGSASATDACGAVTITQSDGSVQSSGCNRSRTRTFTARDGCNNTATTSRTVRWIADVTPPVFVTTPGNLDLECNAAIPSSATPTASDACGTPTVTSTGSTDNPADCSTGFSRVITRSWKATDACGNTATYTQRIRVACCPSQFCTYTQGAYGTDGGDMCDGENGGWTTLGFIGEILTNYGGSFSVGKPGNSVIVNSAQCVIDKLPGGGGAKELVAGDVNLCNFTPLQPNGGVRNILLAQTITLKLNLGIENSQLAGFVLQAGELATADPVNGCGDINPKVRVCHYNTLAPYNLVSVENEYTYRTFTQAVIDAIPGPNTVANLLELANRALANVDGVVGSEGGVSLDAINQAVSYVNEVFDECKIFIGWNVGRCPAIDPTPGDGRVATTTSPTLAVTAYPNPYQENFSLKVNSPVSGQAAIGFYTIDGVKIGELKRDVVANRDVWVPFNVPAVYRTRIVYTVAVGTYNAKGVVLSPN